MILGSSSSVLCLFSKETIRAAARARVQQLQPVLPVPGEPRPNWQIVAEIAQALGERWQAERNRAVRWNFASASDIMDEIAMVTPIYGGMGYRRLVNEGLVWPCPDKSHPGTPILHQEQFSRGLGLFTAVTAQTQDFGLDPVTKIPEFKVCAVNIESSGRGRK